VHMNIEVWMREASATRHYHSLVARDQVNRLTMYHLHQ
jgi:hypothetical protein